MNREKLEAIRAQLAESDKAISRLLEEFGVAIGTSTGPSAEPTECPKDASATHGELQTPTCPNCENNDKLSLHMIKAKDAMISEEIPSGAIWYCTLCRKFYPVERP